MCDAHGWIDPALAAVLGVPASSFRGADDALPPAPGAYVLILRLDGVHRFPFRAATARLGPGTYLYAGSARGPGGIAARLGRHLAGPAKQRWHIDRVTPLAARRAGLALPGGDECRTVETLMAAGATIPLPGFGASDCRTCPGHLLAWPAGRLSRA
jgi:Uri superfamily endonuclease